MERDDALVREALRLNRRYVVEIVERFELCPWADRARREGHVKERVLLGRSTDLAATLGALLELAADPAVEIGLLIFPRLRLDLVRFEHFVSELREADRARHELGRVPFAMAAFHPEARPDLSDPERLIPFLRRTPDPTIQLVRMSVLERVKGRGPQGTAFVDVRSIETHAALYAEGEPSVRDRVARQNLESVERIGIETIARALDDIRRDRDAAYARIEGGN